MSDNNLIVLKVIEGRYVFSVSVLAVHFYIQVNFYILNEKYCKVVDVSAKDGKDTKRVCEKTENN